MKGERGAVAVIVAILLVVLMGFAAIGIDVANMASDRQQLQNGADAGALAIAQGCAAGECGDTGALAQSFVVMNRNDGAAVGQVVSLDLIAGEVTVRSAGDTDHWFAPVLGDDLEATTITTEATAVWGTVRSGTASLPVAISACQIEKLMAAGDPTFVVSGGNYEISDPSETIVTIDLVHPSNKGDECKPLGSPNVVPGGFSFITDGLSACTVETVVGEQIGSDPGADVPSACTLSYLTNLVTTGRPLAIPVFIEYSEGQGGSNSWYRVYAYAGFRLTGFALSNQVKYNASCSGGGNSKCITGYFTNIIDSTGDIDPNAVNLGVSSVRLTR